MHLARRAFPRVVVLAAAVHGFGLAGCRGSETAGGAQPLDLGRDELVVFAADSSLYEVRHVLADSAGTWVLSGNEPYVHRFDRAGNLVRSFGRQGRGPGEILNPWSLVVPAEAASGIAVWDVAARALVGFDSAGGFTGTLPVPIRGGMVRGDIREVSYGEPFKLRRTQGGMVAQVPGASVSDTRDLFGSLLVRIGEDGSARDTILHFASLLPSGRLPDRRFFVPIPLWAGCGDGSMALFDPADGAIRYYRDGVAPERDTVPIGTRDVREEDRRTYLRYILDLESRSAGVAVPDPEPVVAAMLARTQDQFSATAPVAVDLLCGEDGAVWLNHFSTADHPLGYGREWSVVKAGEVTRTIRFPPGFRPAQILGEEVVGVFTNDSGVQSPASIPFPARGSN